MKSNNTANHWLKTLFSAAIPACFISAHLLVPQVALGQMPDEFPTIEQPFRDSAVIPADFQRELQGFTEQLNTEAITADITNGVEDFASQAFGSEKADSIISGLKSQFGDLDIPRVFGSLAIVLGGYFVLVWLTRRFGSNGNGHLPNEVVEVLGQTPFKPGSNLQLVRLGSKLLLLMNSAEGTHTIGEISDPEEVALLCAKCGVSNRPSRTQATAATVANSPAPVSNNLPNHSPIQAPSLAPNTDLRQILRQLQQVAEGGNRSSVFEA